VCTRGYQIWAMEMIEGRARNSEETHLFRAVATMLAAVAAAAITTRDTGGRTRVVLHIGRGMRIKARGGIPLLSLNRAFRTLASRRLSFEASGLKQRYAPQVLAQAPNSSLPPTL
jgi:hypothetical protein